MSEFGTFDSEDKALVLNAEDMDHLRGAVHRGDLQAVIDFMMNKFHGMPGMAQRTRGGPYNQVGEKGNWIDGKWVPANPATLAGGSKFVDGKWVSDPDTIVADEPLSGTAVALRDREAAFAAAVGGSQSHHRNPGRGELSGEWPRVGEVSPAVQHNEKDWPNGDNPYGDIRPNNTVKVEANQLNPAKSVNQPNRSDAHAPVVLKPNESVKVEADK